MEIQQKEDGKKGMFFIEENGAVLGAMYYTWADSAGIIITHTEVDDQLRGKNAGKQMVDKAVTFAREKGIKIVPLCPFAKKVFDRTPEYADVL